MKVYTSSMGRHAVCQAVMVLVGMKYIANISLGKDSLAMILLLMEKRYPIDEAVFFDTEMEFQAIYKNCQRLSNILSDNNIRFTVLKDSLSFEYKAFEKPIHKKDGLVAYGYDWCGGCRRWATAGKLSTIKRYYKYRYGNETIIEYVGLAADEIQRINSFRKQRSSSIKIYPLAEWGMNEQDCLNYCFEHGWNWKENGVELYDVLDRVSCWCCTNKNKKEIQNIITYLPEYWSRIKDYEKRCGIPYKRKGCAFFEKHILSDNNNA